MLSFKTPLYVDTLSLVMIGLVTFVSLCVGSFSARYLKGDRKQKSFYMGLSVVVLSVSIMVCSDHMLLLLLSWGTGNAALLHLMLYKREWEAAKQSSILALKNFSAGLFFLGCAFLILYVSTGQTSIHAIMSAPPQSPLLQVSGLFILLGAMTQSGLWPFHRWLTSSLNSPTPASAIMHAGLVNGGGFLLARFSPLLAEHSIILSMTFVVGICTALLGTLWKLMQSDIKRMLACSTMGQMGFMIAQCGLGLFPAAVAHLCWHGLFKANLFLASGSAAQEKKTLLKQPPLLKEFLFALFCGTFGAYCFALASQKTLLAGDTTLFLIVLALVSGAQFSLSLGRGTSSLERLLAILATSVMGAVYGLSVYLIEYFLEPIGISFPQPFNWLHTVAIGALISAWLFELFLSDQTREAPPRWIAKLYVYMLNASQPHPKTVTAYRNHYHN